VLRGVGLAALIHLFAVQISVVRGHSMEPCLEDGDRLIVDRLIYAFADPGRFDVVVLGNPADPDVDYVKRVVGVPGDRIELFDGVLRVNGRPVDQEFAPIPDHSTTDVIEVPQGYYFVLGDNRPISCDSRVFGLVPQELVRGRVRLRFWPIDRASLL
jgi:signal peptidase I